MYVFRTQLQHCQLVPITNVYLFVLDIAIFQSIIERSEIICINIIVSAALLVNFYGIGDQCCFEELGIACKRGAP